MSTCIVEKCSHDILDVIDALWGEWFGQVNESFLCFMSLYGLYMIVGRVLWLGWGWVLIFGEHLLDIVLHVDFACSFVITPFNGHSTERVPLLLTDTSYQCCSVYRRWVMCDAPVNLMPKSFTTSTKVMGCHAYFQRLGLNWHGYYSCGGDI